MPNEYHPWECKEAIKVGGGVYFCRLGVTLCALHKNEKCYKQRSDEAVQVIKEILERKDDGRSAINVSGTGSRTEEKAESNR